jgi:DNA invertase Pin-like site-specific DNA recombinase
MTAAQILTPPVTSDDAPKRAVIYCRISDDKSGEGLGVERQEATGRALAAARGWEVVAVIVENDQSALKRRPKYARMIKDAESGRFEVVIAWAMDRLSRTPQEVEDVIRFAERAGLIIATANGDLDLSTDQGRMVARILASVARAEVERKSARQVAANRQRAEKGLPPTTGRGFGYTLDGTIIPEEAEIVRELFRQFVAGRGVFGLCKELNERGVLNTKGNAWDRYGLTYLLQNPRYVGHRTILSKDKKGNHQREYIGPGTWEPLVDQLTFDAAQRKFAEQKARVGGKTAPNKKHLGSGLYRCGKCGVKLKATYKFSYRVDGTSRKYLAYTCFETRHFLRNAAPIDEWVMIEVIKRLNRPEMIAALLADAGDDGRARALTEQINGLNKALDELDANQALPVGHPDRRDTDRAARTERLIMESLKRVKAELENLDASDDTRSLALIAGATSPGEAWASLVTTDVAAAQAIVRAMGTITLLPVTSGRIPFDPASVRFEWRT